MGKKESNIRPKGINKPKPPPPPPKRRGGWKIICYIPVEWGEGEIYESEEKAKEDMKQLAFLQPENKYEVVEEE